jgi:hypothetical protein
MSASLADLRAGQTPAGRRAWPAGGTAAGGTARPKSPQCVLAQRTDRRSLPYPFKSGQRDSADRSCDPMNRRFWPARSATARPCWVRTRCSMAQGCDTSAMSDGPSQVLELVA